MLNLYFNVLFIHATNAIQLHTNYVLCPYHWWPHNMDAKTLEANSFFMSAVFETMATGISDYSKRCHRLPRPQILVLLKWPELRSPLVTSSRFCSSLKTIVLSLHQYEVIIIPIHTWYCSWLIKCMTYQTEEPVVMWLSLMTGKLCSLPIPLMTP